METDQLFKELLRAFFREFLELFYPEVAAELDFSAPVTFLDKEMFTDFPDGSLREADTLAEVRTVSGEPELVLFHVEVQAKRSRDFSYRMWEYFSLIRLRHGKRVFPVVIYLAPGAGGLTFEEYEDTLFGRRVNRFRYDVVGLPDLPADDYRERADNPLAPALGAAMQPSAAGRLRQKYDALLRTARSPVDDARRLLLATVVEAFLPLRGREATDFEALITQSGAQEVRQMISVYEQRGIEKGLQQGMQQGMQQGILRGRRDMLLDLLHAKFGELPAGVAARVEAVEEEAELRRLSALVLTAASLDEMGLTSA